MTASADPLQRLGNTRQSYGAVAKTFHWLIALLIVTVIPLGIVANDMAHAIEDPARTVDAAFIARTALLFSIHKTVGVTIFFVALTRIAWALTQPRPGLLNAERPLEATLAETVHWLLYGSLVLVPLTGWIHHAATTGFAPIWWPFGQSLPFVPKDTAVAETFAGLHIVFERVLIASLILHVAGALKHHFVDRDFTLRRMWPGGGPAPEPPAPHRNHFPPVAALAIWGFAMGLGGALGQYDSPSAAEEAASTGLAEVQSDWQVTDGTLAIRVTQLGSPVEGQFADWTAAITFEDRPDPGPAGQVDVMVGIGSLTLGSVTGQALGADYFDAATHPTATFTGQIARTEAGYVATGPLTIKDQSVDITLPFDLQIEDDTARMTATLTVNRLDFGIGTGTQDEATLGFGVDVIVDLTATRRPD